MGLMVRLFALVCALVVTYPSCLGEPSSRRTAKEVWTAEDEALARAHHPGKVEYETTSSSRYFASPTLSSTSTSRSSSRASSASPYFPSSSSIRVSRFMDKTKKDPAGEVSKRREGGCRSCHLVRGHGERKARSVRSDVVILTGGTGDHPGSLGTFTLVDVFDPLGECQVQLPDLPLGRYGHTSHYIEDELYICGGFPQAGSNFFNSGYPSCSHWVDGTFKHHSQLLEDRGAHSGVAMGKHIYLSGGGWPFKTSMETLGVGNTWISAPHMQEKRSAFCSVATRDTTFIVIGGYIGGYINDVIASVEEFNTVTSTWRSRAAMPGGGSFQHSCVNIGGGQILVAGRSTLDRMSLTPLLYDVDTDQWRTAARMNTGRNGGQLVVVNGKILFIGGRAVSEFLPAEIGLDTIEEYDPEADSWTILETRLNTPRQFFGASVVPRSLVGC